MKFSPKLLFCVLLLAFSQAYSQQTTDLPDAPTPNVVEGEPAGSDFFGKPQPPVAPKYSRTIGVGQRAQPLDAKDKLVFSLVDQARWSSFAARITAAGIQHARNGDPKYGSDKAGFGERLGAAYLRQTSQGIFARGVLPIVFHQDPRFYRMGGDEYFKRAWYASTRVLITRTDKGTQTLNTSHLLGYAGAAALTMTYYPEPSAQWSSVWRQYGVSIGTSAAANVVREFSPDLFQKVFHKKK